ncbi:hypothetical protein PENSPDRAFT_284401 [Peniophora sp. CONT]|nr:hypothetical protein PENSPDRAFT_284401 [Peniophora sp. CONT]
MHSRLLALLTDEPLPPPVSELLAQPDRVRARYPDVMRKSWRRSQALYLWPLRSLTNRNVPDTPTASLYRLYEFFIIGWVTAYRNELEYFCRQHPDWAIAELPDPADHYPLRYTIISVLTRLMCESFNRRIELGLPRDAPAIVLDFTELRARPKIYERPPTWAMRMAPMPKRIVIPTIDGEIPNDEDECPVFASMNIHVHAPHIHFI